MKHVRDHETARKHFWIGTGEPIQCIRDDGTKKIVSKYIEALTFFQNEPEPEILMDSENEF